MTYKIYIEMIKNLCCKYLCCYLALFFFFFREEEVNLTNIYYMLLKILFISEALPFKKYGKNL